MDTLVAVAGPHIQVNSCDEAYIDLSDIVVLGAADPPAPLSHAPAPALPCPQASSLASPVAPTHPSTILTLRMSECPIPLADAAPPGGAPTPASGSTVVTTASLASSPFTATAPTDVDAASTPSDRHRAPPSDARLAAAWALVARLRVAIAEATGGCPASAGLGPNMLLARLATRQAKPNGQAWAGWGESDMDVAKAVAELGSMEVRATETHKG